jgi:hypothetical protein
LLIISGVIQALIPEAPESPVKNSEAIELWP